MGTVGVCLVCAKNSMSAPPPAPTPALALVKNIPRHVLAWAIETNRETKAVRFLRGSPQKYVQNRVALVGRDLLRVLKVLEDKPWTHRLLL